MQTEIRTLGTRGFGRRNGELMFRADRVSDGEDEKFFRRMVVMVAKPCDYLEIIRTVNYMLFYVMLFYHNKKISTVGMRDIFLQRCLSSLQLTPKAICLSY